MQVVFAHYHLNPGGVTQVIVNQIQALASLPAEDRPRRIGVLHGGRHADWPDELWSGESPFEVVLFAVSDLDYDDSKSIPSESLAEQVLQSLETHGFSPEDTLLHIHNHALGKNVSWPAAVRILGEQGYRLLLQIHDFAEDFRPSNYRRLAQALDDADPGQLAAALYPQSPGTHYATLTAKDAKVLKEAGVATERLHVLPNPLREFTDLPPYAEVAQPVRRQLGIPATARLVLYPVRGIRRKNVGELLFYSAVSPPDTWHAVTLAPRNPVELPAFERWQRLAEELRLRTLFDICGSGSPSFIQALAASNWLISTSVAEGFGMVFLEAWLAGKLLVGRNLPGVTRDFEAAGLRFAYLRDSVEVPLDWIPDRTALADALRQAFLWACEQYRVEPDEGQLAHIRQLVGAEHGTIDFALLPCAFQATIIRRAASDPIAAQKTIAAVNPGLGSDPTADNAASEQISSNAAIVRSAYSLPTIGRQIRQVYEQLLGAKPGEWQRLAHGEAILKMFLQVDRLHSIRFEE